MHQKIKEIEERKDDVRPSFDIFPENVRKHIDIGLGLRRFQEIKKPVALSFVSDSCEISSTITIKHIAAGTFHVLVTSEFGAVFGWGNNEYG